MADLHAVAADAARKYGVPVDVFLRQINQESGFRTGLTSSAGAQGIAQFMPATARQYGVNTADPVSSLNGAARMMGDLIHRYGSVERALSAYNSGRPDAYKDPNFAGGQTYNYVRNILGGRTPAPAGLPSPSPSLPVPATAGAPAVPAPRGLSSALAMAVNTGNQMFGLPPLPAQLLSPVAAAAAPTLAPPAARTLPIPPGPGGGQGAGRFAVLAPGANRQGVAIQPAVLNFVGRIGQLAGHPLTIGTGTNHNQYVQGTHRESDHWTGYAADIPATGAALTRLGQMALIAAGADPAWARRQTGGLYNIGGKQIIFNSMTGGNHFTHLHVGIRTR